jgi:hypothetical protein
MVLPLAQILDTVIGVIDLVRSRRIRAMSARQPQPDAAAGGLDTRLAGVIAAALREELERDARRLQLEREQLEEAERQRAELALKRELLRQAGDREIGRLRLLAGVAAAGWIGTLLLAMLPGHVMAGSAGARVALGLGWLLLLAAIVTSFLAQSRVADELDAIARGNERAATRGISSGLSGALTVWLVVVGLAFVGLTVLF